MKLYHFCAMNQAAPGGPINYHDGVITTDANLHTELPRVRAAIGRAMKPPVEAPLIMSLTLVGEVSE